MPIEFLRRKPKNLLQVSSGQESNSNNSLIPEVLSDDMWEWEQSRLGEELFSGRECFLASLSLSGDPSKKLYTYVKTDELMIELDIPLTDTTPIDVLLQRTYRQTTQLNDIDPDRYRTFATAYGNRDQLLAYLNRATAGVSPDDVPSWFYDTFSVDHREQYGDVYISSHGGQRTYGYDFHATIRSMKRFTEIDDDRVEAAREYAQVIRKSLPTLNLTPVQISHYLHELQSALPIFPQIGEYDGYDVH